MNKLRAVDVHRMDCKKKQSTQLVERLNSNSSKEKNDENS